MSIYTSARSLCLWRPGVHVVGGGEAALSALPRIAVPCIAGSVLVTRQHGAEALCLQAQDLSSEPFAKARLYQLIHTYIYILCNIYISYIFIYWYYIHIYICVYE